MRPARPRPSAFHSTSIQEMRAKAEPTEDNRGGAKRGGRARDICFELFAASLPSGVRPRPPTLERSPPCHPCAPTPAPRFPVLRRCPPSLRRLPKIRGHPTSSRHPAPVVRPPAARAWSRGASSLSTRGSNDGLMEARPSSISVFPANASSSSAAANVRVPSLIREPLQAVRSSSFLCSARHLTVAAHHMLVQMSERRIFNLDVGLVPLFFAGTDVCSSGIMT
uniref:Uncharacterized protein n=1 Tax=Setaria viridis TaxID=4556 RepID=A0A4U6V0D2_SETVI|nr:hypothetical protein SEVIR_4G104100v2 [Setaria viridis]